MLAIKSALLKTSTSTLGLSPRQRRCQTCFCLVLQLVTLQAILINPSWDTGGSAKESVVKGFARIPVTQLCPIGFVFVWVKKHQISSIVAQMNKWRYIYVESLTWIFLHRNNRILRLPSAHLNRSHLTLFVFRREGEQLAPGTSKYMVAGSHFAKGVTFNCMATALLLSHRTDTDLLLWWRIIFSLVTHVIT